MQLDDFRGEFRAWLEDNVPASLKGGSRPGENANLGGRNAVFADDDHKAWLDLAIVKGITAPTWDKAYGGGGYDADQARVIDAELERLKLPYPLIGLGLALVGPTLLDCGDEAQKREHLPAIASGKVRWCQGYSEPSAGSDLASLRTQAVRDGDDFIVTGQKVWTSFANDSDWIFALVRTDPTVPKHAGISVLLIDLASPGVTVRPIRLISGESPFCETFFDAVRVPARNLVGEINHGWAVAKTLLGYERKVVSQSMGSRSLLGSAGPQNEQGSATKASRLGAMAKAYVGESNGRVADAKFRDEIAQVEMAARGVRLATRYFSQMQTPGSQPGPEGSALKLVGTELNQQRQALQMRLAGPMGLSNSGQGFTAQELDLPRAWLRSRANTIEGGTSEIQLNIIAKRLLGL